MVLYVYNVDTKADSEKDRGGLLQREGRTSAKRKANCMKALSEAEWNIMESLWEECPKVGSRIVADMAGRVGWSRSTTLTMLKRMAEKGLIACEDNGRMRVYAPLVEREAAVKNETDNFLKRVYNGSASMLVSSFIKRQRLSAEELLELRQILDKAEEEHNG